LAELQADCAVAADAGQKASLRLREQHWESAEK
jgi:hypothetical protein